MYSTNSPGSEDIYDAVLVGAGIMSATLATLIHELDPDLRLLIVERLSGPALESSNAMNNAGTGHAANCELNYTPLDINGNIDISKALTINRSFEQSLEFWASLVERGKLCSKQFMNVLPHISFVSGAQDVSFLKQRFSKFSSHAAFSEMEWTTDPLEISDWAPLIIKGRELDNPIAATRIKRGTDIDFGALTSLYIKEMNKSNSIEIKFFTEVTNLTNDGAGHWYLDLQDPSESRTVKTRFVFLGAGGGALTLLQKSGIPEGINYAGFPVSGKWLVCNESSMTGLHNAKVYGRANVGAPPMSVPHLDSRWIDGKKSLLFGPFAGFSTNFLKYGSSWDLFDSIKVSNFFPLFQAGLKNIDLGIYLMNQIRLNSDDRFETLKDFLPSAIKEDWNLSIAGQRVQIIKKTSSGGVLKMGTEVVAARDGSLAALLGASPGASTAVTIMIEVLKLCWSKKMKTDSWRGRLEALFPTYHDDLSLKEESLIAIRNRNDLLLGLK